MSVVNSKKCIYVLVFLEKRDRFSLLVTFIIKFVCSANKVTPSVKKKKLLPT